jgi:hypothetical protein
LGKTVRLERWLMLPHEKIDEGATSILLNIAEGNGRY